MMMMMMMTVMDILLQGIVHWIILFIYKWFIQQIIIDTNGLMQSHGLVIHYQYYYVYDKALVTKVSNTISLYPYLKLVAEENTDTEIQRLITSLDKKKQGQ